MSAYIDSCSIYLQNMYIFIIITIYLHFFQQYMEFDEKKLRREGVVHKNDPMVDLFVKIKRIFMEGKYL